MNWISFKEFKPPENRTLFICGVKDNGKGFYYAEAYFIDNKFHFPYYGQEVGDTFENVTHWMRPTEPDIIYKK